VARSDAGGRALRGPDGVRRDGREVPVEYLYDYRIARARRLFVLVLSDHQTFDEVLDMFQVPASRYTPPRIWLAEPDAILYVMERRDPAAGDDAPGTATR
jgi:hypothetical protein